MSRTPARIPSPGRADCWLDRGIRFNVPCLVDERGVLIAGHGRLLAAKRLGLAGSPLRINRSALASVVSGSSVTSGTISIDAIGSSR
jgi:hypothetical protein